MFEIIKLLRPQQWYKNLLVFLPLFFAQQFTNIDNIVLVVLGFVSLCLISSTNYIINDLVDIKNDRVHPEKRKRPIASGKVGKGLAIFLAFALGIVSLVLAYNLGILFFGAVIFLFLFTQLYSFVLKHEVFADIIAISINFVVRASSGAFIIGVSVSNWLVVGVFFLALFLASGKRHADLMLLKKGAVKHKKTLKYYTKEITNSLIIVSTAVLIFMYALYTFLSHHNNLIFTIPFALYSIFRYYMLIQQGHIIARKPHYGITDPKLLLSSLIWAILTGFLLYL